MRIPLIGWGFRTLAALCAFWFGTGAGNASAQDVTRSASQSVTYQNPADETELTAVLTLPSGPAPHPGIVLFSVAGTSGAVDRWVAEGYAVLTPTLRGFVAVEPLLRAGFSDLAGDVGAALAYLDPAPRSMLRRSRSWPRRTTRPRRSSSRPSPGAPSRSS